MNIVVVVLILAFTVLPILGGLIVLQVFLSRKDSKWLGLILPAVSFILSWIYPLNLISTGNPWQDIAQFALTLLISNIYTIILLIIYAAMRESRKKKAQLKKMTIQDLG